DGAVESFAPTVVFMKIENPTVLARWFKLVHGFGQGKRRASAPRHLRHDRHSALVRELDELTQLRRRGARMPEDIVIEPIGIPIVSARGLPPRAQEPKASFHVCGGV